jgi:hypothetical protein
VKVEVAEPEVRVPLAGLTAPRVAANVTGVPLGTLKPV